MRDGGSHGGGGDVDSKEDNGGDASPSLASRCLFILMKDSKVGKATA